jgi:uncharacterized membrane protein
VATFENTVLIARPIEDVFGFLSDLENVPKWNYAIVETRKVSEGRSAWGPPTSRSVRFRVGAKNAWRSPPTALPASWRSEASSIPSLPASSMPWTPGQREPGSANTVEVELRGPGRLLGRLAVPGVRAAVAANLTKLKELLEG